MNSFFKYYSRRVITTFLIASPCYAWSQTFSIILLVGLAYVLPDESFDNANQWVSILTLSSWIIMFAIGWVGSKYLIVRPLSQRKESALPSFTSVGVEQ